MSSTIETPVVSATNVIRSPRVASIDIFRGLTMALMIFVNELASVKGLPWWNYHAPAQVNVMTYVDMVFPAFLFILGMAIPIALEQRLLKDPSTPHLLFHVVLRTFALLVLGLILANAELGNRFLMMHLNPNIWTIIALIGAILFWNAYKNFDRHRSLVRVLRVSGLAMMLLMFVIFRRTSTTGHPAWIDMSYPEILGLLGWTYFSVSVLYIATRRWSWAPLAWFVTMLAFCAASTAKWIAFPGKLPLYVWPLGNGAMAAIALAGVITSAIFVGKQASWLTTTKQKSTAAIVFATTALLGGRLLTSLGISKIRATPTWCLYSIASSVLLFTLLYYICDIRKATRWANFARPAGQNTLLTYLLPDLYFFITSACGFVYFEQHAAWGFPGVLKSLIFTGLILALSALLTRLGLRLRV